MKPDASHISEIHVVSNTHWDREFRWSFEKTRRRLLTMIDTTLDILENDPAYHSYTMDGHSIMIDDYLDMRPERRAQVERLIRAGRLIIGPWYTLPEQFSLAGESLVRNLLFGRKLMVKYGAPRGTVAYTPASWGQTGQLPQLLADFGLNKMMFYRGFSHHEGDAEWIWEGADGTRVLASRFALYARYNWYYQVHRAVMTDRVFDKSYPWGQRDEAPFRYADGLAGEDLAFMLLDPALNYDPSKLKQAIEDMVQREGAHFTTPIFLAMHGHDISVAHPLESRIIADAQKEFTGQYKIIHTDLESYWQALEAQLDKSALPVLSGERRSYLKQGMWTYLMPATISARTYLKQADFTAGVRLSNYAEPLATLAFARGAEYPARYLERGWQALISNHTHDANGGCAPDHVCQDILARYRLATDIGDIVAEDAMAYLARNLAPADQPADAMQLIAFNPLPFPRDAVALVDLEVPAIFKAKAVGLVAEGDPSVPRQPISSEKSSAFVDNIWDVPTIVESARMKFYARLNNLPALGYRAYRIVPEAQELRGHGTLVTGYNSMENAHLHVQVNGNGTVEITDKTTNAVYRDVNYLLDQGECGNAWNHKAPLHDRVYNSLGVAANVAVTESGPLVATITAEFDFPVPADYGDGTGRSETLVNLPVRIAYRLEEGARALKVTVTVDNKAKDHWLRACCPTGLQTDVSWADSHFDVVSRAIPLPDCTGWVEAATGTHPLRTFVDLTDGTRGLALLPKGLFEYEAVEDARRTLALTLIRACRIKLAVSEEKQTELPDAGVQCPGVQTFEYAICPHAGDWAAADLPALAADLFTPARLVMTGRGKGSLPLEDSLFTLDTSAVQITAVKGAEDGDGLIIRLVNLQPHAVTANLTFGRPLASAALARMDESEIEPLQPQSTKLPLALAAKKIATIRVRW